MIRKLKNNVSQVQLPVDSLHGAAWVLRLFELVWRPGVVSLGQDRRWNRLPRVNTNIACNFQTKHYFTPPSCLYTGWWSLPGQSTTFWLRSTFQPTLGITRTVFDLQRVLWLSTPFMNSSRDICVFLAPLFSGLTAISTYLLTKELWSQVMTAKLKGFMMFQTENMFIDEP